MIEYPDKKIIICLICLLITYVCNGQTDTQQEPKPGDWKKFIEDNNIDIHGFMDIRSGYRTRKDKYEKDRFIPDGKLISPAEYSNYYLPQITEHLEFTKSCVAHPPVTSAYPIHLPT